MHSTQGIFAYVTRCLGVLFCPIDAFLSCRESSPDMKFWIQWKHNKVKAGNGFAIDTGTLFHEDDVDFGEIVSVSVSTSQPAELMIYNRNRKPCSFPI